MLQARSLTKRYDGGVLALQDLQLDVEPGEIYCILGANGAGKTTTLNLFLDFVKPTSGQALVDGIEVRRFPLEAKKRIAYLPENVVLYDTFSALQNLEFFTCLAGKSHPSRDMLCDLLRRVGLEAEAFDRPVRQFSKGMRQKLGIAIAMAKDAPALLWDEPTSGLDPKAAGEILNLLTTLRDQGKAILMSTHDIFRAKLVADRVGILRAGRKVLECSRAEIGSQDLETLYLSYVDGAGVGSLDAS